MTAKDLVGTWTLVSIMLERDGKKTDLYGPNPQGQLTFDPDGRFSVIITRLDLAKFASNDRRSGTPEENKAIVQGSFACFGSYSVSETDKTFTTHIESRTFPNWNGIQRETSFTSPGVICGHRLSAALESAAPVGSRIESGHPGSESSRSRPVDAQSNRRFARRRCAGSTAKETDRYPRSYRTPPKSPGNLSCKPSD